MTNKRRLALSMAVVPLLLGSARVWAQAPAANLDHLLCYKTEDPLKIAAAVDMIAELQPEFTQMGCTLVRPFEFCVPATKINVQPPAPISLTGQPLQDDYICYLARCPKGLLPDQTVIDQFGARVQRKYRPYKVCVPAKKRAVECGPAGRTCGGACPNPDEDCRRDPADGTCKCMPTTACEGRPDKHGMCGGQCPNPTDRCLPGVDAKGRPTCTCQPPPPPPCGLNTATGICGGECPNPTDKCTLLTSGECSCQPTGLPCGQIGPNACGGNCPAGERCVLDAAGACSCQPDSPSCGLIPGTTVCSGNCPNANDQCVSSATGCSCQPPTCSQNPLTGTCGGSCPEPDLKCILDAAHNCTCQPAPCGPDPVTGTCGGTCPAGSTCQLLPGTNTCGCR